MVAALDIVAPAADALACLARDAQLNPAHPCTAPLMREHILIAISPPAHRPMVLGILAPIPTALVATIVIVAAAPQGIMVTDLLATD